MYANSLNKILVPFVLQRQLSKEHWLLLLRTPVPFPAPKWMVVHSHLSVTPVPGDWTSSSALHGCCVHIVWVQANTHIHNFLSINKNKQINPTAYQNYYIQQLNNNNNNKSKGKDMTHVVEGEVYWRQKGEHSQEQEHLGEPTVSMPRLRWVMWGEGGEESKEELPTKRGSLGQDTDIARWFMGKRSWGKGSSVSELESWVRDQGMPYLATGRD